MDEQWFCISDSMLLVFEVGLASALSYLIKLSYNQRATVPASYLSHAPQEYLWLVLSEEVLKPVQK